MKVPPLPRPTGAPFFEAYTRGLTAAELERLFTRDTPDAYRLFSRQVDHDELQRRPWYLRALTHARFLFLAFTLRLAPARRAIYALALLASSIGLVELFQEVHFLLIPHPAFAPGTLWLLAGFLLLNFLVLLEVADRLSLKDDLEIARQIQLSMLPRSVFRAPGLEAFGMTRPANTVGGDFYDILPLPNGRVLLALGDVAGKGSPAALLMALLVAVLRTLVDEGLEGAELLSRLNLQVCRHAPASRFITLFLAVVDPGAGTVDYVNAGQNPPLVRRRGGAYEWLSAGGVALGMFEGSIYESARVTLELGDVLLLYSDGVSEAEDRSGQPFDEDGLRATIDAAVSTSATELGWRVFAAVDEHRQDRRLLDDLTVLVARRLPPLPTSATG